MRNVAQLARTAAQRGPEHPALINADPDATDAGAVLTWGQLDAVVDAEVARLRDAGAAAGDRIAVRLHTSVGFCIAVLGALRAGCAVVPIAPAAADREIERVLADSGARLMISDDEPAAGVAWLAPPSPRATAAPAQAVGGGEDLAVLAFTSGTSGLARGVMLSHRALLANVEQCAGLRPAPVTAADRVLLALPLFHVYGLGPGLLQVAAAGATAVLLRRFEPELALEAVQQHRVTTVVGVPPMYQAWLRLPAARLRTGFATVRLFTSGAAPLLAQAQELFRDATGLEVFEGYGLTETGPVLTSTLVGGRAKPGSVGRPLPGVELRLVDADNEPLPDGLDMGEDATGTGLVSVRGANLFSGYWPDGEHGPDGEGWFRTGDVGYLDADGDLHLVDRAGDLIIVNGFNVYPHEVERVLAELPGVTEAAAIGVPDDHTGETVKVVLVLAPGVELNSAQVIEHCAARLAKFKVPTIVRFADALPYTATGKLARRVLRTP